jgi:aspartate dehydrogenase
MKRLRAGIVGCGAIGGYIAVSCETTLKRDIELAAICDTDEDKIAQLNRRLKRKVKALELDKLIESVDIVIEAASAAVSAKVVKRCIDSRKACLVMSVGGLLGRETLLEKACAKGINVFIPSGAICGIDALKAASMGKIESVMLTTRKPPSGLVGAPYLAHHGIDVLTVDKEMMIFEGNAADAVKAFPANVNVSAVLSLAGMGARNTKVRIVTSPDYTKNIHEIEIIGDAGRIVTRTENLPSTVNPKTSTLAMYSAIAMLKQIAKSVRIGT